MAADDTAPRPPAVLKSSVGGLIHEIIQPGSDDPQSDGSNSYDARSMLVKVLVPTNVPDDCMIRVVSTSDDGTQTVVEGNFLIADPGTLSPHPASPPHYVRQVRFTQAVTHPNITLLLMSVSPPQVLASRNLKPI